MIKKFASLFLNLFGIDFFKEIEKFESILNLNNKPSISILYHYQSLIMKGVYVIVALRKDFQVRHENVEITNDNGTDFSILNELVIPEDIDVSNIEIMSFKDIIELSHFAIELRGIYSNIHNMLSDQRKIDFDNLKGLIKNFIDRTASGSREEVLKNLRNRFPGISYFKSDLDIDEYKNDLYMISKHSDLNYILDSNKQKELKNELKVNEYFKTYLNNSNEKIGSILDDLALNKNSYLSGVSSFVFIKHSKFLNELNNKVNKLISHTSNGEEINGSNVINIFIITNNFSDKWTVFPTIYNIKHPHNNESLLNLYIFNLNDYCHIYSSLNYEQKIIRNIHQNRIQDYLQGKSIDTLMKYNFLKMMYKKDIITNSIICYKDIGWSTTKRSLAETGINLNVGETSRRGLISPIQYDLSLFLNKYLNVSHSDIVRSYNNVCKSHYTSKGIKYPSVKLFDPNNLTILLSNYYTQFESIVKENISLKYGNDIFNDELSEYKLRNIFLQDIIYRKVTGSTDVLFEILGDVITSAQPNKLNDKTLRLFNKVPKSSKRNFNNLSIRGFSTSSINGRVKMQGDYYDNVKSIINEGQNDPIKTQIRIEKEWINILMNDLNTEQNVLRSRLVPIYTRAVEGANTTDFKKIIQKLCGNLSLFIITKENILISLVEIVENYRTSKRTNIAKKIGVALMRQVFNKLISREDKLRNTNMLDVLSLGSLIEIVAYTKSKDNLSEDLLNLDSKLISDYKASRNNLDLIIEYQNKANSFLVTLGTRFLELFSTRPNMVFTEVSEYSGNDGGYTKLILSDEYKEIVDSFTKLNLRPKNLPMVCKPLIWSSNQFGGYLENRYIKDDVITGSISYNNHEYLNKEKLFNTINYFNSIPFSINTTLLDYIQSEGKYLIENTNKLSDDSLKLNTDISIKIANLFRNIPFYLNTHADWRGRIYTHSFYISYQGSELSSALLQFWRGETLTNTGKNVFLAYGASLYGSINNSKTEEEKIEWINDNKNFILNLDREFILKSESPISFAAFCLEMIKYEKDSKVEIKLPVYIDATSSGIQHISSLIGDIELARKVNLIPNPNNNKPEDFYLSLVEPINKAINDYGKEHKEYQSLAELHLTRKILKQPIMTLNYNVSVFGMKEQLFNRMKVVTASNLENPDITDSNIKKVSIVGHSKEGKEIKLTNRDLIKISMIIKDIIFIEYPALKMVYDYFIDVAILMKNLNLSIQWITPTGAVITQNYTKREKTKLKLRTNNKIKTIVLYKRTNKIDHLKQIDGIIPNVIHSLDSSHIINLINESSKNINFSILTVHDCFGTHPNYIEDLFSFLKQEFINLYINHDFLKKFDKNIVSTIRNHYAEDVKITKRTLTLNLTDPKNNQTKLIDFVIPTPPSKKDLNYNFIRFSKWMFH